jgi:hypothetical protein
MAQYDPQRSRTRHRSGDDPAAIDALLGAVEGDPSTTPDVSPVDEPDADHVVAPIHPDAGAWTDPDPYGGGGRSTIPPVVVVGLIIAGVAVLWALLRRRRRDTTEG